MMRVCTWMNCLEVSLALIAGLFFSTAINAQATQPVDIWAPSKLHAWEVPTIDLVKRTSDERAKMLKEVGFQYYAYLPMGDPHGKPDINTSQLDIDAEIEAMKKYGIGIRAWYFWVNVDDPAKDPTVMRTLEAFKRHDIHPQIWIAQSFADPAGAESKKGFPTSAHEQTIRVKREAARIAAFVKLAAPYGCSVNLYNHLGWFGMMDNQLAILSRLKELGITNVGMIYNFGHSKSELHDDSINFTGIWERIKPHVVTVNIWVWGARELKMMRVIQESGWRGAVGMEPVGGNAELNLRNALWTAKWAAAQLNSDERTSEN